jgi:hypothetical protein
MNFAHAALMRRSEERILTQKKNAYSSQLQNFHINIVGDVLRESLDFSPLTVCFTAVFHFPLPCVKTYPLYLRGIILFFSFYTALQAGRSRVRFPMGFFIFFIDLILLASLALWSTQPLAQMSTKFLLWVVEASDA